MKIVLPLMKQETQLSQKLKNRLINSKKILHKKMILKRLLKKTIQKMLLWYKPSKRQMKR